MPGTNHNPRTNVPLHLRAEVDGQTQLNLYTAADPSGTYELQFRLPKELKQGVGKITATVGEPARETITEEIPIASGRSTVEFYPESGHWIAGVLNRVYFVARSTAGQTAAVAGHVVDRSGKPIVRVETTQAGRGVFQFTPRAGELYSLRLDTPASRWRNSSCRWPVQTAS